MRVVPRNNGPKIQFFMTHLPKWAEHPEQIGTSPQMVAELQALTDEAREALKAQQMAQQAARAATLRLRTAVEKMASNGSAIIMQIRAKAEVAGDSIYPLASLPPPQEPAPIARPGTPYALTVKLHPSGAMTLRWRCDHPRGSTGTVYHIWRQIGIDGESKFIGISGSKRFIDDTVPRGAARIIYKIQAIRSMATGDAAEFPVNLGGGDRLVGAPILVRKREPVMMAA